MPDDFGNGDTARAPAEGAIGMLEPVHEETTQRNKGVATESRDDGDTGSHLAESQEATPPALPPRPPITGAGSMRLSRHGSKTQLQGSATTALSLADVHTQTQGEHATPKSSPASRAVSRKHSFTHFGRFVGGSNTSDGEDSLSLKSFVPTLDVRLDNESILGDASIEDVGPAGKASSAEVERGEPPEIMFSEDPSFSEQINREFDIIDSVDVDGGNEESLLAEWKSKLKHFFILSASGKPIYSRHGGDQLTSNYIGIAQTLISFYQEADNALRGFTAGGTRFVVLSKGPLNLIAISRLGESEAQLKTQLESLYMQILSTLTLPSMERMFIHRPSTDLRRPLQGTDVLLDGLADGFTRGSPSTLLSALECLRLRKTHRRAINDTLLKVRAKDLLYGLIVAAGRLVSVVRPKKHSLHPGDLHLIFNMLFEAGSVKAAGGENWIPLCLPGFNNTGFLYMYVSFFSASEDGREPADERPSSAGRDDELAIVLISANKEAFYDLRTMRDQLVAQLESNGSMETIKTAIRKGHVACSDIVPGSALRHFLYKSRGNVQFVMPSLEPSFHGLVARRKLMTLYGQLHEALHSRTAHLKVQHVLASDAAALAWETPLFELYCVAGPQVSRAALTACANSVVQWIRREEERIFIIGGAVF